MTTSLDAAELLCHFLALLEAGKKRAVDPREFSGVEPRFSYEPTPFEEQRRFLLGQRPWPGMEVSIVRHYVDGTDGFVLDKFQALREQEKRGLVKYARFVLRHAIAEVTSEARVRDAAVIFWRSQDGRNWMHENGRSADAEAAAMLEIVPGVAWAREREWRVLVGFEGSPEVSLATSPGGAAEWFRLRDVPPGKSRRVALRNWVKEHWRSKGSVADAVKVRRHLRGAERFQWSGLSGRIVIPTEAQEMELLDMMTDPRFQEAGAVPQPEASP